MSREKEIKNSIYVNKKKKKKKEKTQVEWQNDVYTNLEESE